MLLQDSTVIGCRVLNYGKLYKYRGTEYRSPARRWRVGLHGIFQGHLQPLTAYKTV